MLRVGFSRKDMHQPKAWLTARSHIVVGDPFDASPVINDRLDILGFGNYTIEHNLLLASRQQSWRSSGALHPARSNSQHAVGRDSNAFNKWLQFNPSVLNGANAARSFNRRWKELRKTPRRL